MMQQFRICPTNKLLIEWKLSGDHWGFYRICDSPNDAKRSMSVIQGDTVEDSEQISLLDLQEMTDGQRNGI
jgi:hypothetical protein